MPSKKKNKRPQLQGPSDSLRLDIEKGRDAQLNKLSEEDGVIDPFADYDFEQGLDLADQLLASLDERDAAAKAVSSQALSEGGKKSLRGDKSKSSAISVTSAGSAASKLSSPSKSGHGFGHDLREAGGKLLNGITGHHETVKEPTETKPSSSAGGASISKSSSLRRIFGSPKSGGGAAVLSSPPLGNQVKLDPQGPGAGKKKVSRQQQRKERKAAEIAAIKREAEEELKANGGKPDEAEVERKGIQAMCAALGVTMHEITPDGHCLYAAVADQLNTLGKVTKPVDYRATRKATAEMMRTHPDDFKPFISDSDEHMAGIENKEAGSANMGKEQDKYYLDYCDAIENTGVWGGQPEILALSRAFKTQINVVQAGSPVLKVGEGESKGEPLIISYHRKMYGLGEVEPAAA
ncbi:cysteine proteinase [Violaceomyces palustris]|uniref:Cysteine proteinase n=1 Tax=Violaceomyces palustris TaxID=1673888 RepID=A0ACD0NP38_9BASI|nr:cysteine proteinase [Violaceomyces palustris]